MVAARAGVGHCAPARQRLIRRRRSPVLEWAAQEGRILLTHDVSTLTHYAYARVAAGKPMPGVFEVPRAVQIGVAIEDILLLAECSLDSEWEGQVRYLPLR